MALTTDQWHRRFIQQARWTKDLRNHLYDRLDLSTIRKILDVGCGTGVLQTELLYMGNASIYGLDLDTDFLAFASQFAPGTNLLCGDAYRIPVLAAQFDLTLCHYFLLWVDEPAQVLAEMIRVTRPGGLVMAFAEPDYGGRIDYPDDLSVLGHWQEASLQSQGADSRMGRQLRSLFSKVGLEDVETGVLGGQWTGVPSRGDRASEWQILLHDLSGLVPEEEIKSLKRMEESAWERGERILYVPTFYAWGRVVK